MIRRRPRHAREVTPHPAIILLVDQDIVIRVGRDDHVERLPQAFGVRPVDLLLGYVSQWSTERVGEARTVSIAPPLSFGL